MKKTKRILAVIGIVLLVAMYACTLLFAIFESSATFTMFKISIACTIIIPVLLYVYSMIFKLTGHNRRTPEEDSDSDADNSKN